jgi:hypothetical protein
MLGHDEPSAQFDHDIAEDRDPLSLGDPDQPVIHH